MPRPPRRDKIVRAATVLFNQKGFKATTVRDIAQKAGMQSGGLYAHFSSKEDILYEIMVAESERGTAALAEIVESDLEPDQKLLRALTVHIEANVAFLHGARLFLTEWRLLSGRRRTDLVRRRRHYETLWDQILQEGIDDGCFAITDIKYARLLALSAANWTHVWFDPKGPETAAEVAERFAALLLAAYTGEAPAWLTDRVLESR